MSRATFNHIILLNYALKTMKQTLIQKIIYQRIFLQSFLLPSHLNFNIVKKIYQYLSAQHNHCRLPQ